MGIINMKEKIHIYVQIKCANLPNIQTKKITPCTTGPLWTLKGIQCIIMQSQSKTSLEECLVEQTARNSVSK